jgi:hypothetical protein
MVARDGGVVGDVRTDRLRAHAPTARWEAVVRLACACSLGGPGPAGMPFGT